MSRRKKKRRIRIILALIVVSIGMSFVASMVLDNDNLSKADLKTPQEKNDIFTYMTRLQRYLDDPKTYPEFLNQLQGREAFLINLKEQDKVGVFTAEKVRLASKLILQDSTHNFSPELIQWAKVHRDGYTHNNHPLNH